MANKKGKRQQGSQHSGNRQKGEYRQQEQQTPQGDQQPANPKLSQHKPEQFNSDNPSIVRSEN